MGNRASIENGFSIAGTITNQNISLTFTPPQDMTFYDYVIYKDGKIYLSNTSNVSPTNFLFTEQGQYKIEISYTDSLGFKNTYTSENYIIDREAPVISVSEDRLVIIQGSRLDLYSDLVIKDNYSNDLSANVTTNYEELNLDSLGQQKLVYTVVDEAGNMGTKTVLINVVSGKSPILPYIQLTIMVFLIALIVIILRYIKMQKKERRIAIHSINIRGNEISLLDRLFDHLDLQCKILSRAISKSILIQKHSKRFEKCLVVFSDHTDMTAIDIISSKIICGIIFILIAIISFTLKLRVLPVYTWIVPFLAGYLLPNILYYLGYKSYRKKIENDLLQAIIIMNNAFKSGRSITQAVQLVTTELEGPISQEFAKMNIELSFGLDINTVFKRFAERVNVDEANYLTASLTILNKTGGNIVKVFSSIEKSLFSKKRLKLEMNALTSSSKIIKYVLFVVPIIFFILINLVDSTYFVVFFTNPIGIMLFVLIVALYLAYIFIVTKAMNVRM